MRRHFKESIPSSSITWSEMGNQIIQAKEVYCRTSKQTNKQKLIIFSNSLKIHEEKTKEITAVKEVWICSDTYYHKTR